MASTTDHELLTIAEAAELLRVDRSTIRRWIKAGRLHALHPGPRTVRLRRSELTEQGGPEMYWLRTSDNTIQTGPIPPLSEEERARRLEYLEYLRQRRHEVSEKYGPFEVEGWELLHEAREERTRQLTGEE